MKALIIAESYPKLAPVVAKRRSKPLPQLATDPAAQIAAQAAKVAEISQRRALAQGLPERGVYTYDRGQLRFRELYDLDGSVLGGITDRHISRRTSATLVLRAHHDQRNASIAT